ncbi:MAG: hypothetical protein C0618_03095 [Desulfuromonas sp.]|nr:MAG: hypothetical protein C0618_03095 [Desulfuromonas sp.]
MNKPVENVDNLLRRRGILGVFAKEPVPGQVKTRLCPPFTVEQAAALYCCALSETIATMSGGDFDLAICYAGDAEYFRRTFPGLPLYPQRGKDLGARMDNALQGFLAAGYRSAVLIGSDSPDLPLAHVQEAFAALTQQDLVVAPARDGGYVLIGEARHIPALFEGVVWSSDQVLSQTLERAQQEGVEPHLLPQWEDLDTAAALTSLLCRSPQSQTAAFLRNTTVAGALSATADGAECG